MGTAAIEMNLTKGALSYQIQQLESGLGFLVFSRARRKLELTEKGGQLFELAQASFSGLEREIGRLRLQDNDRITIGMATYFASRWLSPRLMHFITDHPDIALRIQPLIDLTDLYLNDLNLVVRWGKGEWNEADMNIELLFQCPARLTSSVAIGEKIEADGIESVLEDQTFLHDRDGSNAWQDWFAEAGIEWIPDSANLVIPDPNVRVQSVIDGQGLALYDFLVEDEVNNQRLYQYNQVQLSSYGFYLVYPKDVGEKSAERIFRDWIMVEAAQYR